MTTIKWTEKTWDALNLKEPFAWEKPCMVLTGDLFDGALTDEQLDQIFAMMALTPQHTYQVLTKHPERMQEYCDRLTTKSGGIRLAAEITHLGSEMDCQNDRYYDLIQSLRDQGGDCLPLPNVWLGVTVENQKAADERIPLLLRTPAALRFLSCEPLLEEVDILSPIERYWEKWIDFESKSMFDGSGDCDSGLSWAIIGGESGRKARFFDITWARSIIGQCKEAGVPVFMKQLGTQNNWTMNKLGASIKGNNPEEWPEDLRVREYPAIK